MNCLRCGKAINQSADVSKSKHAGTETASINFSAQENCRVLM